MKSVLTYLFIFLLLLSSVCTNAQKSTSTSPRAERVSFSGRITDAKSGAPLPGASIYFSDLRVGTSANNDGKFTLVNIAPGTFLIEVSHLGYGSFVQNITLSGNTNKDFALAEAILEHEGVTVTGVSSATSVKRTPVPVDIVKRDDLMRGASTNLVDALSRTPGVSQISTGPAISKPTIRGLGYNRLVVINDGIRQEGQQWGDEHGLEIDELNVTKAEVLKGPASLMYGSDALAGVINIISINPVAQGTIKGNLLSTYQTNIRQRGFHADLGGNKDGFIWGGSASYKAASDYQNKYDGYVLNSKFNERNFGGYVGLNKHWGFSHLYVSNFNQRVGLVEGARDSATGRFKKEVVLSGQPSEVFATKEDFISINPLVPRQQINHLKVASENTLNVGRDRLAFTIGYQRNQRQEFGNILDPEEKSLYFDLNTINYNVQYHLAAKDGWKTSIGVNGMQQSNRNKGEEVLIPAYNLLDAGVFVYTQKATEKATFSGGIRYDNRHINSLAFQDGGSVKFNAFSKNFSNVSGSVGVSYEASKQVTLKLNAARGFRAPSIPELASNGAHEGTNRYEYGTQNLKSEQSLQLDAGIAIASEHVSINANVFYNSIDNFIYYRKLNAVRGGDSIITDGSDDFFAFRFDQQNASLYGGEFNVDIHPHPLDWLHLNNTFSYVRGQLSRAQDGSSNLPWIPAPRLINEVKVDFLKNGKTLKNVYFKTELDNTFIQNHPFTGFDTETETPGYSLLNIGAGGDVIRKGKTICSIYINANNVTDEAYQNHLSRLKYTDVNNVTGRQGVFNVGRNFSFKVNFPLEFTKQ